MLYCGAIRCAASAVLHCVALGSVVLSSVVLFTSSTFLVFRLC